MTKKITVIVCIALWGAGCALSPVVFTTRLQDVERRNYYASRDTFSHDETAAIVVSGQSGHDVSIQLRKSDLDMVIQRKTFYIKRNELKWVYWKGLPPGTYLAELIVQGETNAVTRFTIEPENRQTE